MSAISRRLVLVFAAVLSLAACGKGGGGGAVSADEMTLGDPKAKVTMIEYASVACPVCAEFNNTTFDELKKKYIDTGKVYYVFREALTGNQALAGSGFLLARCAGKDNYFKVTDAVFRSQEQIYAPGTEELRPGAAREVLSRIAQQVGLSDDQLNKCLTDPKAISALNDRVVKYSTQDKIEATPTFIINGKKYEGDKTMADMDAILQPLVK
jgi:protein-disulfide isomerase